MPNDNATTTGPNKRLIAIIAAVAAVVAIICAVAIPSCGGSKPATTATKVEEKLPDLDTDELVRPKSGPLAKGEISIVNAEELYVRLLDEGLPEAYESNAKGLTLKVNIGVPGNDKDIWTKTYAGEDLKRSGAWGEGGTEVSLVLDSLRAGESLADQKDDDGKALSSLVAPGADMVVYACALYGEGGIDNDEGESVNSLFAKLEAEGERKVAVVSALRHLANLDKSRADKGAYGAVRLDSDVAFSGAQWDDAASVSVAARSDGHASRPISYLTPIQLVDAANTRDGLIQGDGHALRGFVVGNADAPTDNTGVFSALACEVASLTITNASVVGAQGTGALAGVLAEGANVHDCSVVVEADANGGYPYDAYRVTGSNIVGGLVGRAGSATIKGCVSTVTVTGGDSVGGLVGEVAHGSLSESGVRAAAVGDSGDTPAPHVSGSFAVGGLVGSANAVVAIERCYAAVAVLSNSEDGANASRFGGLVGSIEGGTEVRNSYATGMVRAGSEAGGLVGRASSSDIRASYATGAVRCNTLGAGFVGVVSGGGTIESSRSYGQVTNVAGTPVAENGGFFAQNDSDADNIGDSNAFMREGGYNDILTADANKNDGKSYGRGKTSYELMVDGGSIVAANRLHPYSAALKGDAFPYEEVTGLGEIWGDWPSTRTARWYRDNGELISERTVPLGSEPTFGEALRLAERPQDYYADQSPYYLFMGWDTRNDENGDFVATAKVMELPFQEFFPDEPTADWARPLRQWFASYVDDNLVAQEDFVIDSMAPDAPSNPEGFSYQITGKQGSVPVMVIGQKLPAAGQQAGTYRVLRYDMGAPEGEALKVGYATAKDVEKDGTHYYVYDAFTADNV